jgi:hypothetical protein
MTVLLNLSVSVNLFSPVPLRAFHSVFSYMGLLYHARMAGSLTGIKAQVLTGNGSGGIIKIRR